MILLKDFLKAGLKGNTVISLDDNTIDPRILRIVATQKKLNARIESYKKECQKLCDDLLEATT